MADRGICHEEGWRKLDYISHKHPLRRQGQKLGLGVRPLFRRLKSRLQSDPPSNASLQKSRLLREKTR